MATDKDENDETVEGDKSEAAESPAPAEDEKVVARPHSPDEHEPTDAGAPADELEGAESQEIDTPAQLGHRKFVYAAYFAGAIGVAFLSSKFVSYVWMRLNAWKPNLGLGEPRDEVVMPAAALIGAVAAFYYWKRTRARKLAEEVAGELSKVTWPSRKEVTNSTAVVIVTTLVSTIFFALMDRFWGFITDKVYTM